MNKLAIIGLGPRGLYALENVLIELSKSNKTLSIDVFEPTPQPGSGQVWNTKQPDSNWINITERTLTGITERPEISYNEKIIKSFPSYHQWCNFSLKSDEPDTFPPRNKMGRYLFERFNSLEKELKQTKGYKRHLVSVTNIELKDNQLELTTEKNNTLFYDQVVLTIGHQPTEISDQLKSWKKHEASIKKCKVFTDAYPVEEFESLKNNQDHTIGIRGFGLAAIDIIRFFVSNEFGDFKFENASTKATEYIKSKEQNLKIVPFSLDGLPLAPKPLNKIVDDWYKPSEKELNTIKQELESITKTNTSVDDITFLTSSFSKIAANIFHHLKDRTVKNKCSISELQEKIENYLDDDEYSDALIQDENISTYELIKAYVDMALGQRKISLDYCIWQVWRHCQPTFYKAFSYTTLDDDIIKKVIALDERSKRFSYGPPIESMQQLIALVDAEILDLNYTKDPKIKLIDDGFKLSDKDNKSVKVDVMINSVLDAPELLKVNSDIIKNLLKDDLVKPIHSELGIETDTNAYVKSEIDDIKLPIAVLGRLAKGSVMGVDAILECFGERIENWAKHYVGSLKD